MIRIDETNHGQRVTVKPGEEVEIGLAENPTAGFRWRLDQAGQPVCALQSDRFDPGQQAPGQPGTHSWRFAVVSAGEATIHFSYRRSWEPAESVARTFEVRLSSRK